MDNKTNEFSFDEIDKDLFKGIKNFLKEKTIPEIFKLISPAFQTIVGGFIGLLAGVKLSHGEAEEK